MKHDRVGVSIRTILSAAALALVAPASAGLAQSGNQGADSINIRTEGSGGTIVVTGDRELEKERVVDALRDIAMRDRTTDRALTRFQAPVCPLVVGLGDKLGADIKARIEANTRLVGHTVAAEGCRPNAFLIMVDDPERLINRMRRERRALVNVDILRRARLILNADYPAISWGSTIIRDRYGNEAQNAAPFAGLEIAGGAADVLLRNDNRFASRIEVANSIDRTAAVVVFDAYKLDNVHLDQLADYATMRILGDPQPFAQTGSDQPDTILNLFRMDPLDAAPGLTLIDLAYLRGLYAMRPRDPGTRLEHFVLAAYENLREGDCTLAAQACAVMTR